MVAVVPVYRSLSKLCFIEIYDSDSMLIASGGVGRSPDGGEENAVKLTPSEIVELFKWLDEYMKGRKTEGIVLTKISIPTAEKPDPPVSKQEISAEVKEILASLKISHDRSEKLLESLFDWINPS